MDETSEEAETRYYQNKFKTFSNEDTEEYEIKTRNCNGLRERYNSCLSVNDSKKCRQYKIMFDACISDHA